MKDNALEKTVVTSKSETVFQASEVGDRWEDRSRKEFWKCVAKDIPNVLTEWEKISASGVDSRRPEPTKDDNDER